MEGVPLRAAASFLAEVLVNLIQPPDEFFHVVEEELRFAERLILEPATAQRHDRQGGTVRGENIVKGIARVPLRSAPYAVVLLCARALL